MLWRGSKQTMKKCPFCAEEIQDEAIKCKHCQEMLEKKSPPKWYFKTTPIVIAFLCVGPLALPLVWFHPRISKGNKIILTIAILILSYILFRMFMDSLKSIKEYYLMIFGQSIPGL